MSETVTIEVERGRNWGETVSRVKDALAREVDLNVYRVSLVPESLKWNGNHVTMVYRITSRRD
ncbi:MAG: hypothetical protein V1742_12765 [Pseudomonadota bacterium]